MVHGPVVSPQTNLSTPSVNVFCRQVNGAAQPLSPNDRAYIRQLAPASDVTYCVIVGDGGHARTVYSASGNGAWQRVENPTLMLDPHNRYAMVWEPAPSAAGAAGAGGAAGANSGNDDAAPTESPDDVDGGALAGPAAGGDGSGSSNPDEVADDEASHQTASGSGTGLAGGLVLRRSADHNVTMIIGQPAQLRLVVCDGTAGRPGPATGRQMAALHPELISAVCGPMFDTVDGTGATEEAHYRTYTRAQMHYLYQQPGLATISPTGGHRDAHGAWVRYTDEGLTLSVAGGNASMVHHRVVADGATVAVQGFPPLVDTSRNITNPAVLTNQQHTPRCAVGILGDGRVFLAASTGGSQMTPFADVLIAMGAIWALYTDGGGSRALYARGQGDALAFQIGMDSRRVASFIGFVAEGASAHGSAPARNSAAAPASGAGSRSAGASGAAPGTSTPAAPSPAGAPAANSANLSGDDVMPPGSDLAARHSSFHLISMAGSQNVHQGPAGHAGLSWGLNGCGPTSRSSALRWLCEQGQVTGPADLMSLVADPSRNGSPWEYYKLIFPTVNPDSTDASHDDRAVPRDQWVPNPNGMVPWMSGGGEASCDHELIVSSICSYATPNLTSVTVSSEHDWPSDRLGVFRRWLRNGPITICLNHPAHFVSVHGVVGGKLLIADPGNILWHVWWISQVHNMALHRADHGLEWRHQSGDCAACNELRPNSYMPAAGGARTANMYLAIDPNVPIHWKLPPVPAGATVGLRLTDAMVAEAEAAARTPAQAATETPAASGLRHRHSRADLQSPATLFENMGGGSAWQFRAPGAARSGAQPSQSSRAQPDAAASGADGGSASGGASGGGSAGSGAPSGSTSHHHHHASGSGTGSSGAAGSSAGSAGSRSTGSPAAAGGSPAAGSGASGSAGAGASRPAPPPPPLAQPLGETHATTPPRSQVAAQQVVIPHQMPPADASAGANAGADGHGNAGPLEARRGGPPQAWSRGNLPVRSPPIGNQPVHVNDPFPPTGYHLDARGKIVNDQGVEHAEEPYTNYSPRPYSRAMNDVFNVSRNGSFISRVLRVVTRAADADANSPGEGKNFETITGEDGLTFGITDFTGVPTFVANLNRAFPDIAQQAFGSNLQNAMSASWYRDNNHGNQWHRDGNHEAGSNDRGAIRTDWLRRGLDEVLTNPALRGFQLAEFIREKCRPSLAYCQRTFGASVLEFTMGVCVGIANSMGAGRSAANGQRGSGMAMVVDGAIAGLHLTAPVTNADDQLRVARAALLRYALRDCHGDGQRQGAQLNDRIAFGEASGNLSTNLGHSGRRARGIYLQFPPARRVAFNGFGTFSLEPNERYPGDPTTNSGGE